MQSMIIRGGNRLLLSLAICQILKVYDTLKISYLIYIAIIHKAMLVSSGKRQSRVSRPLICYSATSQFKSGKFSWMAFIFGIGLPQVQSLARTAECLRHWTLNQEIVGSSPAVRLVFST